MPIWNWDRKTWREMFWYPRFGGAVILLITLPFIIPYVLFLNYIKNLYLCQGIQNCVVWGSDFMFAILFGMTGILPIWYLVQKVIDLQLYRNRKRFKINLLFFLPLIAVAVVGILIGFKVYVKSTENYIEISDPLNIGLTPLRLEYSQITGVGKTYSYMFSRNRACKMTPYITLKDKSVIILPGAMDDFSFINYLQKDKNIPNSIGGNYNC